jgi:hypothetical protein
MKKIADDTLLIIYDDVKIVVQFLNGGGKSFGENQSVFGQVIIPNQRCIDATYSRNSNRVFLICKDNVLAQFTLFTFAPESFLPNFVLVIPFTSQFTGLPKLEIIQSGGKPYLAVYDQQINADG